jgi:hypothetical protein
MTHYLKWKCRSCGYRWDGLSPSDRSRRPVCPKCNSWSVSVERGYADREREKWKEIRKYVLKRDNYTCRQCGKKLHGGIAQIHHVSYNDYFDPDNMITLCQDCHKKKHVMQEGLKILIWIVITAIILFFIYIMLLHD